MKLNRIMLAAPESGSGKTTITCALLQALKNRGKQVVSYKCGPDYIDPLFHQQIIDIPSKNLDTFFTGEQATQELLVKGRTEEEFAVIEGVMGLFDGLGGIQEEGSSYHLAKVTGTPIILVIDAKGMGRSVIPLIAGFLAYDKEQLIEGVILNRMSGAYYEIIKPLIEEELGIRVLGYFPNQRGLHIESRHLGLVMPHELTGLKRQLQEAAGVLEETVEVSAVEHMAEQARELPCRKISIGRQRGEAGPIIAVARDDAFCFYYEDNLLLLQEKGAELTYFSPLHDRRLPENCDALLIGGGYPELYAEELSRNISMRSAVRQAFEKGLPIVAEGGGFLYLHDAMITEGGVSHAMAGAVPAVCENQGKLVRFGYIEIKEKESFFLPEGEGIKGHEFHYFDSTCSGESCIAVKPAAGREYFCVMEGENYWLGLPHLYYPSNPSFAENFVKKAQKYKERKGSLE